MRFSINREEFLKNLNIVGRIIQSKIDPILSNFKLDLTQESLVITGSNSNGDLSIVATIPTYTSDKEIIRNIEEGSILVNAKMVSEIVKRTEGEEISFEVLDESLARIESDNSTFKLNVTRSEEYRDFDLSKEGIKVEISAEDFIDAVNEVSFCASEKSSRPILLAVNVECNSSMLTFTATDGARLGRKDVSVSNNELFNVNIPSKALLEAVRTITNEKTIYLYIADKKVTIEFENTILVTRLIQGDYPNVKNIIPRNFYYFLEVNANEFLNAMGRVSLFSSERENVVKVTMEEGRVIVSSKSQQVGSAEESLSLFKYTGERLEMSFNCDYVASAIRALKSQDVLLSFVGEMKPFTVTNKGDESVIQLITPVRTY